MLIVFLIFSIIPFALLLLYGYRTRRRLYPGRTFREQLFRLARCALPYSVVWLSCTYVVLTATALLGLNASQEVMFFLNSVGFLALMPYYAGAAVVAILFTFLNLIGITDTPRFYLSIVSPLGIIVAVLVTVVVFLFIDVIQWRRLRTRSRISAKSVTFREHLDDYDEEQPQDNGKTHVKFY